jgi:phosphoglycerol transferase MdoB-like AlkP superfamily enzyme
LEKWQVPIFLFACILVKAFADKSAQKHTKIHVYFNLFKNNLCKLQVIFWRYFSIIKFAEHFAAE